MSYWVDPKVLTHFLKKLYILMAISFFKRIFFRNIELVMIFQNLKKILPKIWDFESKIYIFNVKISLKENLFAGKIILNDFLISFLLSRRKVVKRKVVAHSLFYISKKNPYEKVCSHQIFEYLKSASRLLDQPNIFWWEYPFHTIFFFNRCAISISTNLTWPF